MASPYDAQYAGIRAKIIAYANKYGLNPDIAIKQIWAESGFNPRASSGKANGIAQFTPDTARRFGVNVNDVDSSLNGYGKYMRFLLDRFKGDYRKALAGYNAGEGAVDKYGGVPPYAETQGYVAKILGGDTSSYNNSGGYQNIGYQPYALTDSQKSLLKSGLSKEYKTLLALIIAGVVLVVVLQNSGMI